MAAYSYGGKPHEDEWNDSTIYCEDGVCRTVVVDPDSWVVKSETTEHVYRPHVNEYRHSSPRKKVEHGGHEKWRRPSSPDHPTELDDFFNRIQIEASRPNHKSNNSKSETTEHVYGPHVNEYRHSSPRKKVEHGGHEKWRRPSSPDHPTELDDFFNRIQIEASRPNHKSNNSKPSGGAATYFRPNTKPQSNSYGGGGGVGVGGYNNKPTTGNYPIRNDKYDDYYGQGSPTREWDRPVNHATGPVKISSPVGGRNAKLGIPTNSIEEAIDYLKGPNTKISPVSSGGGGGGNQTHFSRPYGQHPPRVYEAEDIPPRHQYQASLPWPRSPSPPTYRHGYPTGVIDSNEAARRFGGKIVRI